MKKILIVENDQIVRNLYRNKLLVKALVYVLRGRLPAAKARGLVTGRNCANRLCHRLLAALAECFDNPDFPY